MTLIPTRLRHALPRLLAAVLLLGAASARPAHADASAYPSRPITIVIQYPAGGPSDILARILAPRLQARLGQPVIIEARVGAGGNIGTDVVAKAQPDGHTLLLSSSGPLAISPWLYPRLPYDPLRDLAPVIEVAAVPLVLLVNQSNPARDAQALLAELKASPGRYTYGSSGNGTPQHLSSALLESTTGARAVHVPYKGQAPMAIDLMGGQIDFAIDSMVSAMPNLTSGRLRPPGRHQQAALRAAARRSHPGRSRRAGLRVAGLVRPDGARGDAGAGHLAAQPDLARHHGPARGARADRTARQPGRARNARTVRRLHPRRAPEMGRHRPAHRRLP